jgi:hypothetical protein
MLLQLLHNGSSILSHSSYSIIMQLSCEQLIKLKSLIEYFYAIPGAPSKAVKPEQLRLKHHKIFIQSTSQGSRCLKKGTKLLYHKEVHHSYTQLHAYHNCAN